MDFIYLYEIEKRNLCNCFKWFKVGVERERWEGVEGKRWWG
jgi:hypothetical protein